MKKLSELQFLPTGRPVVRKNQTMTIVIDGDTMEFWPPEEGAAPSKYNITHRQDNTYVIVLDGLSSHHMIYHNDCEYFHSPLGTDNLLLKNIVFQKGNYVAPLKTNDDIMKLAQRKIPFEPCIVDSVPSISLASDDYLEFTLSA